MPEPARMVPLYIARVADLRVGRFVAVTCRRCGHIAELAVAQLRDRLPRDAFIKHLGAAIQVSAVSPQGG